MKLNASSITAIILTFNEELNLDKCLKSIKGLVSEIVVIDSGSTDKTKEIAESFGAKFVVHAFNNQAEQFNWALANTNPKGDWILRLDADEELLPELKREIEEKLPKLEEEVCGIVLRRRTYFLGKWMKHGGIYPTKLLRIFRNGKGMSEVREMDEHLILTEGREMEFENDFIDDSRKPLHAWIAKHRVYATREARTYWKERSSDTAGIPAGQAGERRRSKKTYYAFPPFIRAFAFFVYRYVIRLGFLDGAKGFLFALLQVLWYRSLVDVEILRMWQKK